MTFACLSPLMAFSPLCTMATLGHLVLSLATTLDARLEVALAVLEEQKLALEDCLIEHRYEDKTFGPTVTTQRSLLYEHFRRGTSYRLNTSGLHDLALPRQHSQEFEAWNGTQRRSLYAINVDGAAKGSYGSIEDQPPAGTRLEQLLYNTRDPSWSLYDRLAEHAEIMEVSEAVISGRPVLNLTWNEFTSVGVTYQLDPAHKFQPVRTVRITPIVRDHQSPSEQNEVVLTVQSYIRSGEVELPRRFTHEMVQIEPSGERRKLVEIHGEVTKLVLRPELPADFFEPSFPPGTEVRDHLRQVIYEISAEGEPTDERPLPKRTRVSPADTGGLAVAPYFQSSTLFGMIGCVLIVSALLWRRWSS